MLEITPIGRMAWGILGFGRNAPLGLKAWGLLEIVGTALFGHVAWVVTGIFIDHGMRGFFVVVGSLPIREITRSRGSHADGKGFRTIVATGWVFKKIEIIGKITNWFMEERSKVGEGGVRRGITHHWEIPRQTIDLNVLVPFIDIYTTVLRHYRLRRLPKVFWKPSQSGAATLVG